MLSEISQTEKDKYCMVSHLCGNLLRKKKEEEANFIEIENRMVGREKRREEEFEGLKKYKLSVIRRISSGDLMYSMVTIVNDTVLYT